MGSIEQYQHLLYRVVTEPEDANVDDSGNYIPTASSSLEFIGKCRDEKDNSGTEIELTDGKYVKITSIIQMPLETIGVPEIKIGDMLVVKNKDGTERITAQVRRFRKGYLHNQAWI